MVVNQNGAHIHTERAVETEGARVAPVPDEALAALLAYIERDCSGFSRNPRPKAADRAGPAQRRVPWLTLRHTAASLIFDVDAALNIFDVQCRSPTPRRR